MVHVSEPLIEQEEEGLCNLIFVGVKYTGPKSSETPNQLRQQYAWPGFSAFQNGRVMFGLMPDWTADDVETRTVDGLFGHPNFEVVRKPEDIAEELLERNYLPPDVFGPGYDARAREELFDALGLEDRGIIDYSRDDSNEEPYREQLREIAGVEEDEEDAEDRLRSDTRVSALNQRHTWDELLDAYNRLTGEELSKDTPKPEVAEMLADMNSDEVSRALNDPYYEPDNEERFDRAIELQDEYDRGTLVSATGEFDHPFDNPTTEKTNALAEYLASKDDDKVDAVIEDIQ